MKTGFGTFTAFETDDDRLLRGIEEELQLVERQIEGSPLDRDPDLAERISKIRGRTARYEKLSGRWTLALERLWSVSRLFFHQDRWESWDVSDMMNPGWSGPEAEEAKSRGFFGGLWVANLLLFAWFGSRWFLLPAAVLALLTVLVVWLPLERRRLLVSLRKIQGRFSGVDPLAPAALAEELRLRRG